MGDTSKHWSKVTEAGSFIGMKTLLICYRIFGMHVFRIILAPVILYFYATNKYARASSQEYLSNITPLLSLQQQSKISSIRHFWTFGDILLDKFLVWMGQIKKQDVLFETPDAFQQMDTDKRGGIIVVSHLGNTEICSALAHQMPNIKVTMLVYTQHAEKFNKLMQQTGDNASINLMQVTDMSPATAMVLSERIQAGEYIVIAGDRTPINGGGRVSKVKFLGKDADLPQGAFILACLLNCPVYLMFCLKQGSRYHIYLEMFAQSLTCSRKERSQKLESAVIQYATRLEHYCLKAPLQWFNFFPFWQDSSDSQKTSTKK